MFKKSWLLYLVAALAITLFFTVSLGGCGGSSSSHPGYSQNDENGSDEPSDEPSTQPQEPSPTRQVWQQDTAISLRNARAGFDFDGNGKMDFLDFSNVGQFHLSKNVAAAGLPRNSSFRAASEVKFSVPAMVWLEELRPRTENPNIFQVYLEKDKEYTFEFSKNFTDNVDANFPDLEIFDPENAALPFYEAVSLTPEITPIPSESPSLLCYTIKPEVSGYYLVKVSSQKSSIETYIESEDIVLDDEEIVEEIDSDSDSEDDEPDKGCVIFVYEEFRNEDGEPGYFTRFKFADINGNTTDALSIREIIQLRKLFLEVNPDYFETVYGQNMADDEFGDSNNVNFDFNDASNDLYLNYLNQLQGELGLVDVSSVKAARTSTNSSKTRLARMRLANLPEINVDNDGISDDLDSADLALKEFYSNDARLEEDASDLFGAEQQNYSTEKVLNNADNTGDDYGAGTNSGTNSGRSTILAAISGLPYEPTYRLGTTYSAITDMSPVGGVTAIGLEEKLKEAYEKSNPISLKTNFWTELVTTREESEKHSEVTAGGGVAVAKKAAGEVNFSVGTTSNYKYGLTSVTLVIHFEVVESDYRLLTASGYNDFAMDNKLHKRAKKLEPDVFRKQYGDYFVAGYQYGACYEASVAISTETMEQIDEVKSTLQGKGSYDDVTVSLDLKTKMTNTLKKNNARLSISVITTGLGVDDAPTELPIVHSQDIAGIEQVFSEYTKFRAQIMKNMEANNRKSFVPIRAYWMRWRSLPCIADQVIDTWAPDPKEGIEGEPGWDGSLPITPEQMGEAQAMHSALVDLRAYYNASDRVRGVLPAEIRMPLSASFDKIIGTITAKGEDFYTAGDASGDKIGIYLPSMIELASKCKDYTDRYIFYNKLILAQKKEEAVYSSLLGRISGYEDDSGNSTRLATVRQMPFGTEGGGESGFKSFPPSTTVTRDFAACEKNPKKVFDENINKPWGCHKRYYYDHGTRGATRLEWYYTQRENTYLTHDWQEDVGDAYLEATALPDVTVSADVSGDVVSSKDVNAVFAYVHVSSSNANAPTDRRRYLNPGAPAVGRRSIGFRFMSGYTDKVDWLIEGVAIRLKPEDYPFDGLTQ